MGRTRILPTARGVVVAALIALLIALSALGGLRAARDLAAALLVALVVSAVCALLAARRLDLVRRVEDDAVTAPGAADVALGLAPDALLRRLPVASGTVRCLLPTALGGPGELVLRPEMPHRLPVLSRGVHALGTCEIRARDALGMLSIRRTAMLPGTITGLPRVEPVPPELAGRLGLAPRGAAPWDRPGAGEIGPLVRPYVSGDDPRRIHWRATARTGSLMTREDEPVASRAAVVVVDDRRRRGIGPDVEERRISVGASVWALLQEQGWDVRLLDARGDELAHATTATAGAGATPLAEAADAEARRRALLALARLVIHDSDAAGRGGGATTEDTALAVIVTSGPVEELAPLAGRAPRRVAIVVGPGDDHPDGGPGTRREGDWTIVALPVAAPLDSALRELVGAGR